jgi:hypothetical protein
MWVFSGLACDGIEICLGAGLSIHSLRFRDYIVLKYYVYSRISSDSKAGHSTDREVEYAR